MKTFSNSHKTSRIMKIFVFAALAFFVAGPVFAAPWAPPPFVGFDAPPAKQATSTLNITGILQTKLGGLIVGSGLVADQIGLLIPDGDVGIGLPSGVEPGKRLDVGGFIKANSFCIGSSCITSWNTNPPGITGVKKIIPGEGISISPLDGKGDVTIANTGISSTPTGVEVKLFCISNNPGNHNQCPSGGWISAGVLDNGGSSWCVPVGNPNGSFTTWSEDAVVCYKNI